MFFILILLAVIGAGSSGSLRERRLSETRADQKTEVHIATAGAKHIVGGKKDQQYYLLNAAFAKMSIS